MEARSFDVVDLMPHGAEMVIIDRLIAYEPTRSIAIVEITPECAFAQSTGVPAWVGIEYMAQTIAAHAGFEARLREERPALGFLLGTRAYECSLAQFPMGSTVSIIVEPLYLESGLGAFNCRIEIEEVVATAVVNIYQPEDAGHVQPSRKRGA